MDKNSYSVTFACYNALEYTKKCIESMKIYGPSFDRLVIVDNGSNDGTTDYLQDLPIGGLHLNKQNLGCGVAWNQGALQQQAEWSIIMNNDVVVSEKWIESLIQSALEYNLRIISPSLIEGPLDYDFDLFSKQASLKMKNTIRLGNPHAVCMAVHESVWMDIGYFQPIPKLWGYEDTLFFHEARKAKIRMATTGASWLHHFGSITQTEMKRERGLSQKQGLTGRYNYRYLNQGWFERKIEKYRKVKNLKTYRENELKKYGMTLHGTRQENQFLWL